jgi:hypothetical protein
MRIKVRDYNEVVHAQVCDASKVVLFVSVSVFYMIEEYETERSKLAREIKELADEIWEKIIRPRALIESSAKMIVSKIPLLSRCAIGYAAVLRCDEYREQTTQRRFWQAAVSAMHWGSTMAFEAMDPSDKGRNEREVRCCMYDLVCIITSIRIQGRMGTMIPFSAEPAVTEGEESYRNNFLDEIMRTVDPNFQSQAGTVWTTSNKFVFQKKGQRKEEQPYLINIQTLHVRCSSQFLPPYWYQKVSKVLRTSMLRCDCDFQSYVKGQRYNLSFAESSKEQYSLIEWRMPLGLPSYSPTASAILLPWHFCLKQLQKKPFWNIQFEIIFKHYLNCEYLDRDALVSYDADSHFFSVCAFDNQNLIASRLEFLYQSNSARGVPFFSVFKISGSGPLLRRKLLFCSDIRFAYLTENSCDVDDKCFMGKMHDSQQNSTGMFEFCKAYEQTQHEDRAFILQRKTPDKTTEYCIDGKELQGLLPASLIADRRLWFIASERSEIICDTFSGGTNFRIIRSTKTATPEFHVVKQDAERGEMHLVNLSSNKLSVEMGRLARCFSCIECLNHVLIWKGDTCCLVELPRMNLRFEKRNGSESYCAIIQNQELVLVEELNHLRASTAEIIAHHLQPLLSFSLLLQNRNTLGMFLLVANRYIPDSTKMVRRVIASRMFSTHLELLDDEQSNVAFMLWPLNAFGQGLSLTPSTPSACYAEFVNCVVWQYHEAGRIRSVQNLAKCNVGLQYIGSEHDMLRLLQNRRDGSKQVDQRLLSLIQGQSLEIQSPSDVSDSEFLIQIEALKAEKKVWGGPEVDCTFGNTSKNKDDFKSFKTFETVTSSNASKRLVSLLHRLLHPPTTVHMDTPELLAAVHFTTILNPTSSKPKFRVGARVVINDYGVINGLPLGTEAGTVVNVLHISKTVFKDGSFRSDLPIAYEIKPDSSTNVWIPECMLVLSSHLGGTRIPDKPVSLSRPRCQMEVNMACSSSPFVHPLFVKLRDDASSWNEEAFQQCQFSVEKWLKHLFPAEDYTIFNPSERRDGESDMCLMIQTIATRICALKLKVEEQLRAKLYTFMKEFEAEMLPKHGVDIAARLVDYECGNEYRVKFEDVVRNMVVASDLFFGTTSIKMENLNISLIQLVFDICRAQELSEVCDARVDDFDHVCDFEHLILHMKETRCYFTAGTHLRPALTKLEMVVFEFFNSVKIRKAQYDMVNDMFSKYESGMRAVVHHAIMGCGKTSIICPLLCLAVTNRGEKRFVVVVCPKHLLHQTSEQLRMKLCNSFRKNVNLFEFDR